MVLQRETGRVGGSRCLQPEIRRRRGIGDCRCTGDDNDSIRTSRVQKTGDHRQHAVLIGDHGTNHSATADMKE